MTRDYSQFFSKAAPSPTTARTHSPIERLGWQPFFMQQCTAEELEHTPPVRVVEVHRNGLQVLGDGVEDLVPPGPDATVGDWLLYDRGLPHKSHVLERKSLFKRRAAGTTREQQMIAANVDTAFIVTSCNNDFNVARLERYVALAFEADVTAVILLTKTDLCDDPSPNFEAAQSISDRVAVIGLNALSDEPKAKLADWCKPGQTIAFMGSSGVGKSTLTNALCGDSQIETAAIREDDSRGRHTTTRRQLHFIPNGCAVLDTPGMRELQLTDAQEGIADVFADITEWETQCRFRDCRHEVEPDCAVLQAVEDGELDETRLARWRKLQAEERFNTATLAERRANAKAFGKMVKTAMTTKKKTRG